MRRSRRQIRSWRQTQSRISSNWESRSEWAFAVSLSSLKLTNGPTAERHEHMHSARYINAAIRRQSRRPSSPGMTRPWRSGPDMLITLWIWSLVVA
jgi:hypothetical protein